MRAAPGRTLKALIIAKRGALLALLWLTLTGAAVDGLVFGLVATALGLWLSLVLLPPGGAQPSLLQILRHFPGFIERSVRGGIDVAWRALHPRLPVRPGWYVHETRLPEGGARVALGSVVSLLPGTLVAGSFAGRLYVHCLVREAAIERQVAAEEARLAATLERRGAGS